MRVSGTCRPATVVAAPAIATLPAPFARLLVRLGAALFLAAWLFAPSPPAFAQDAASGASLEALPAQDGPLAAKAGEDVALAVVRKQDGAPLAEARVDWSIEGPEGASLAPDRSITTRAADAAGAGVARSRFRAAAAGDYVVTAKSQTNPGCTGDGCADYVTETFAITVAPVAMAERDGDGRMSPKVVGTLAALGGAAILLATGNGGNGGDDEPSSTGQVLTINTGAGQSALPNAPLPVLLSVKATDDGHDAAGVTITWTASGGATLSATTTTTNQFGLAGVFVTSVGPGPAPVVVTATRSDSGASVSFTFVVLTPGLAQVSGNGQSAPTSTTVPQPLVVRATLATNPQPGVTINWTVTSGDATIASVTNPTDANGLSSAVIDLGPTPGPVTVQACRADFPAVCTVFTLNSTLTRTLTIVSGDGQTGPPNGPLPLPLVVNAQNNGAPIAGVTINWSASGGATLSSPTSVTDAAGNASVTVTSTGPGPSPIQVFAVRADDPTANVTFSANIVPPTMSIVTGDNQSGLVNQPAGAPLEIVLLDGASQPVAGQTITWQVTGGSATLAGGSTTAFSTTDALGHATMTFSYGPVAGPITIRASAYSGAPFVDFSATSSGPTGGSASGGDGQVGAQGSTLAPLTVTISPAISGVMVNWVVTLGDATVSPTTSFTDAAGQASTTLTLGYVPGPVQVRADIQGDGSVFFNATITGTQNATTLVVVSGNGQTLPTGQPSQPMVVELKDGATPLAGMSITWTTNNGTVATFSTVTDAQGRASNTVTPGAGGAVNVTATFAGFQVYTGSFTTFTHNATIASIPTLTTDEAAVAIALDNACTDLQGAGTLTPEEQDLLNQCLALGAASGVSPVAVAEAISEMLPDVAETQANTGQTAVGAQFDNLKGRMAALRSGASGMSFGGLALVAPGGVVSLGSLAQSLMADETPAEDDAGFSKWGLFASGNIGRGESDPRDNTPSYDFDVNGITVGVDYRMNDNLVVGGALGYTKQDTDLAGDQGSVAMRGWSFSGYGSWYLKNSWYFDAAVTFGQNRFDNKRRIVYTLPLPGGGSTTVNQVARADFDGDDRSITMTFGRDFHRAAWGGTVYGRLLYSRLGFDAFDEELDPGAGSGLGLHVDSRTNTALSSVFGGKLTWTHSTSWGVVIPTAQLEWQKEYKSDPDVFSAVLIDDPTGTPILITGEPLDSSYFRVGVGMAMVLTKGRSGFVLYEKMLGRDGMDQDNLTLGFRMEF
jgi:uncharacterized protein with beta-barrel porin domain